MVNRFIKTQNAGTKIVQVYYVEPEVAKITLSRRCSDSTTGAGITILYCYYMKYYE